MITKSDCMSVTGLYQTVRYICHVVDVCSELHKDFHDFCLFSMSDQLVVGVVFRMLLIEKLQKHSFALQHDH